MGVGEELARDDPKLNSFDGHIVGKIKPSELLGFVFVVSFFVLYGYPFKHFCTI